MARTRSWGHTIAEGAGLGNGLRCRYCACLCLRPCPCLCPCLGLLLVLGLQVGLSLLLVLLLRLGLSLPPSLCNLPSSRLGSIQFLLASRLAFLAAALGDRQALSCSSREFVGLPCRSRLLSLRSFSRGMIRSIMACRFFNEAALFPTVSTFMLTSLLTSSGGSPQGWMPRSSPGSRSRPCP